MDKTKGLIIRSGGSLSWEERKMMINEYLTGKYTKVEIWKKYTGHCEEHGQLLVWMRKLGYLPHKNSNEKKKTAILAPKQSFLALAHSEGNKTVQELEQQIRELKKQLELSQLKAEGYQLMIDIAEKEFNIPIRKKSNTK